MTFDLEEFKAGVPAVTRNGIRVKFVGFCEECDRGYRLVAFIKGSNKTTSYFENGALYDYKKSEEDLVGMMSRHQHMIDNYDTRNTYQISPVGENVWSYCPFPVWDDTVDYRLHPHNDIIKAWHKGAKIEVFSHDGVNPEPYWYSDPNPIWDESLQYRIKPEVSLITAPFPELPFQLTCGNNLEVRKWLKSNGYKWVSGKDLTEHNLEVACLNVHINEKIVTWGDQNKDITVFDPFNS